MPPAVARVLPSQLARVAVGRASFRAGPPRLNLHSIFPSLRRALAAWRFSNFERTRRFRRLPHTGHGKKISLRQVGLLISTSQTLFQLPVVRSAVSDTSASTCRPIRTRFFPKNSCPLDRERLNRTTVWSLSLQSTTSISAVGNRARYGRRKNPMS